MDGLPGGDRSHLYNLGIRDSLWDRLTAWSSMNTLRLERVGSCLCRSQVRFAIPSPKRQCTRTYTIQYSQYIPIRQHTNHISSVNHDYDLLYVLASVERHSTKVCGLQYIKTAQCRGMA